MPASGVGESSGGPFRDKYWDRGRDDSKHRPLSVPSSRDKYNVKCIFTKRALVSLQGRVLAAAQLLNVYLMRYLGWCRPGTLSADMLWHLRENQWRRALGICYLQTSCCWHWEASGITYIPVIFNHLKLLCLQSVSSALVSSPARSGCTTELLQILVPHQCISQFTIALHHSSVFQQFMNSIQYMSQQTGLSKQWANSWRRPAPPKPSVYIAIDRIRLLNLVFVFELTLV